MKLIQVLKVLYPFQVVCITGNQGCIYNGTIDNLTMDLVNQYSDKKVINMQALDSELYIEI